MGKGRKSQISIFIIVGILLLVVVGLILYIRSDFNKEEDILDYMPESLLPVEKYMVDCMQDISRDGLNIIGLQGGYIELPPAYSLPRTYLQNIPGGFKTPLWKFDGRILYPSLDTIEEQLQMYMDERIPECAESLTELETVQHVEFISEPKTKVEINEDDVSFMLDYKIKTEFENKKTTYDKYGILVPLKLKKILEDASYLLNKNDADLFISRSTLNLMALDAENIPLGDMQLSCQPMIWSKTKIQDTLQNHLQYMLPRLRLGGTEYRPFQEPLPVYERIAQEWDLERIEQEGLPDDLPSDIYEYIQYYWDLSEHSFGNNDVTFTYLPKYGMNLEVTPSSGDIVKAKPGRSSSQYLRFLCINIYHFTYDVFFPVKVSITDETAFERDGYTFNFAIPIYIDHNIPSSSPPSYFISDARDTDLDFCTTTRDEDTFITVRDATNGDYLSGVNLTYDCFKYYCGLGTTENLYGVPEVKTNFPQGCANGFVIAEKPGYLRLKEQILDDSSSVVDLSMLPLKDLNFALLQYGVFKPYTEDYTATIYIRSLNHDFEEYLTYPSDITQLQLIDTPETYELQIYLFNKDNLVGGWYGNWSVDQSDLDGTNSVIFFAKEFPDMVHHSTPEKVINLYQYLENDPDHDPYRLQYYPEFR